jgi:predicted GIY-YIG superfamily endonuclease
MKIVYIYGILDENSNITYVGKSTEPKRRLIAHGEKKCRILDKFEDKEHYWIEKLTEEGIQLKNKEKLKGSEDWEIGDTISVREKKKHKILHKPSGIIYDSVYQAANALNMHDKSFMSRMRKHPNSKLHDIFTILED